MKNKSTTIFIILGLLLVVSFGGYVYFLNSNLSNLEKEIDEVEIESEIESLERIDNSYLEYGELDKIYKDDQFGFSLVYPSDWLIEISNNSGLNDNSGKKITLTKNAYSFSLRAQFNQDNSGCSGIDYESDVSKHYKYFVDGIELWMNSEPMLNSWDGLTSSFSLKAPTGVIKYNERKGENDHYYTCNIFNKEKNQIYVLSFLVPVNNNDFIEGNYDKEIFLDFENILESLKWGSKTKIVESKFYGVIQTARDPESGTHYQLTYMSDGSEGYLFASKSPHTRLEVDKFWGKCVEVTGDVIEDYPTDTYHGRGMLSLESIDLADESKCRREYTGYQNDNEVDFIGAPTFKQGETVSSLYVTDKLIYEGKILRNLRPDVDIAYDYEIDLEYPNIAAGDGSFSNLIIVPSTTKILVKMEESVGKEVVVKGALEGGYAESIVLKVYDIE